MPKKDKCPVCESITKKRWKKMVDETVDHVMKHHYENIVDEAVYFVDTRICEDQDVDADEYEARVDTLIRFLLDQRVQDLLDQQIDRLHDEHAQEQEFVHAQPHAKEQLH